MDIIPYTQTTCQSCLPSCLLMLRNKPVNEVAELKLLINGFKRFRDIYALGILDEFSNSYQQPLEVVINNKWMTNYYRAHITSSQISINYHILNEELLRKQNSPFILYIDNNSIGSYSHEPHFVIVQPTEKQLYTIDPWTGKRKKTSYKILIKGVNSLSKHLKICPILISTSE